MEEIAQDSRFITISLCTILHSWRRRENKIAGGDGRVQNSVICQCAPRSLSRRSRTFASRPVGQLDITAYMARDP